MHHIKTSKNIYRVDTSPSYIPIYLSNWAKYTWWYISLPSIDIWKWIPGYIDEKCLQEDLSSLFVSFLPFEFPSYPIIVWERVFYNIMVYQYKEM